MNKHIEVRLKDLDNMTNAELQQLYGVLFGVQPHTHNKQYLHGFCAYRLQELELGGLSQKARDQLRSVLKHRSFSTHSGAKNKWRGGKSKPEEMPPVGTELISKCGRHRCHVAPNGEIEFNGERYPTPTAAAKAAVGSNNPINGRQFWCLPPLRRLQQEGGAR